MERPVISSQRKSRISASHRGNQYRSEPANADAIAREVARMFHIADVGAGFIIANEDFAPAALEQWCATVGDLRPGEGSRWFADRRPAAA